MPKYSIRGMYAKKLASCQRSSSVRQAAYILLGAFLLLHSRLRTETLLEIQLADAMVN